MRCVQNHCTAKKVCRPKVLLPICGIHLSSTNTMSHRSCFTILSEISMLLPDCGIQQNSASKSDLHLGNDIFAFKYYARVGILWQKSAQHWQFPPTMGRTVDVNRHHMLVEQWTAHSQHRTAPPLVNVSLPCQLRDPTPQELWHKKWERGGDRVRFCSDSSSALKLGAEIKSVVQTPPPPNQFIIGCWRLLYVFVLHPSISTWIDPILQEYWNEGREGTFWRGGGVKISW